MGLICFLILPVLIYNVLCDFGDFSRQNRDFILHKRLFWVVVIFGLDALIFATCFIEVHFGENAAIVAFILLGAYGYWRLWLTWHEAQDED